MRYTLLCFVLFFCVISPSDSRAQLGWQWAVNSHHPFGTAPNYAGYDMQPAVRDDSGYLVAAGYCWGDTAVFGHDTIYNTTTSLALVVSKLDTNGNFLWTISTQHATCNALGLTTDKAGNIFVLGEYDSVSCTIGGVTLLNPSSPYMLFIAKLSPAGTVLWAQNIAPNFTFFNDQNLKLDKLGNIYVYGSYSSPGIKIGSTTLPISSGSMGMYVAKFDPSGTNIWARGFAGTGLAEAYALNVLDNGEFFISGSFNFYGLSFGGGTIYNYYAPKFAGFLAKFDSTGNYMNGQLLTQSVLAYGMMHDTLSNIYMVGTIDTTEIWNTDTLTTVGGRDVFLARFDSSCNFKWARSSGSVGDDNGYGLGMNGCGQIWISGTQGPVSRPHTFHFGVDTLAGLPGSTDPMFVAEYDTLGTYVSSFSIVTGGDDWSNVVSDHSGNFYVLGDMAAGMAVFGPDTLTMGSAIIENMFVAKYKYSYGSPCPFPTPPPPPLEQSQPLSSLDIAIFPNPATGECTVHSDVLMDSGSKMELYDVTGRLIRTYSLSGTDQVISVSGVAPGMYACKIQVTNRQVVTRKLVVMQ